jgi:hypothetical protein
VVLRAVVGAGVVVTVKVEARLAARAFFTKILLHLRVRGGLLFYVGVVARPSISPATQPAAQALTRAPAGAKSACLLLCSACFALARGTCPPRVNAVLVSLFVV